MGSVKILSKREIQRMRDACALAAETLCHVGAMLTVSIVWAVGCGEGRRGEV